MDANDDKNLIGRIVRLEQAVADISRRLDSQPNPQPHAKPQAQTRSAPDATPRVSAPPKLEWGPVSTKSQEWWLARGGALLTLVALVLLYQYAVEHNLITPLLRVVFGTFVGAALMFAGHRMPNTSDARPDDTVGLREVLLGSAIGAWYITAYAAAVFYGLISLSSARVIFFVLSIAGCWLALRERRSLLALLALGVGFATPAILPSPVPSVPAFAIYVGALGAVGLTLFLMRGWQSILWLTFGAFWWSTAAAASIACCSLPGAGFNPRIALTAVVVLMGIAMVRVPILRQRLLALGSHLYTASRPSPSLVRFLTELAKTVSRFTGQPGTVESPALWIITLFTPLVAIGTLAVVWPWQSSIIWGVLAFVAAAFAYRLASSPRAPDEEFTHVEAAAVALWSLAGIVWLANGMAGQMGISQFPTIMIAVSLHAFVAIRIARESTFSVPARLARLTTLGIVLAILLMEMDSFGFAIYRTVAEIVGIAVAGWVAWIYRHSGDKRFSTLLAVATYGALLLVDARVLGAISRPLITASYAIAGTWLLFAGRDSENAERLKRAGGITLIVVVIRLLMIDMADVETIWRVLLFLGVGALFLFASNRMQKPRPDVAPPPPAPTSTGSVV